MKALFTTLTLSLLAVPAFAVDTTVTYSSGILVLLFVGFCALLIVAQLVPAVLMLFGLTKAAGRSVAEKKHKAVAVKSR
ncbi:MAG: hypothetical protein R6W66_08175 [Pelovirga sp.]|jgi:hypothetical protein